MSGQGHARMPSEGLHIGEGFPTAYSSFAAAAAPPRSTSPGSGGAAARSTGRSHKNSLSARKRPNAIGGNDSPPLIPLEFDTSRFRSVSHTPSSSRSSPFIGFDASAGGARVSTKKSWHTVLNEFKKRWIFVVFFLAFSSLLVFGVLLPQHQRANLVPARERPHPATKSTVRKTGAGKRDGLYAGSHRASRQDLEASKPTAPSSPRDAGAAAAAAAAAAIPADINNRFARWTHNVLGGSAPGEGSGSGAARAVAQPVAIPSSDFDTQDPLGVPLPRAIRRQGRPGHSDDEGKVRGTVDVEPPAYIPASRRSKRRTADELDRDEHEHPGRKVRAKKLHQEQQQHQQQQQQYDSVAEEQEAHKRALRKGVMERVARAIKAAAEYDLAAEAAKAEAGPGNPPGFVGEDGYEHVLATTKAAHPEEAEDGDSYQAEEAAAAPGDLDYEEEEEEVYVDDL